MADAIEFVNANDKVAWQPVTDEGEKLWKRDDAPITTWDDHQPWGNYEWWVPRLYRRRAKALRVARRRERESREDSWIEVEGPDESA